MRTTKYALLTLAAVATLTSCNDEDWKVGNPQMGVKTELGTACFGDSLRFTINASDAEVPLSTLRARLYFGEELVSEDVIRTKDNGKDYAGAIYVP